MVLVAQILDELGSVFVFIFQILETLKKGKLQKRLLYDQIVDITLQAFWTTAFSGFFVGAIMSVQFNDQLKNFGTLSVLGGLATSATMRELGPLLIAFMLSGKIGAFTAAELGTMRVTEQIDAMRCLGVDPFAYLVLPRFLGIVISSLILLLVGLLASILGGIVLGNLVAGLNYQEYIGAIPLYVSGFSVASGIFKCVCFSLLLAALCTFKGYQTRGGAKGVGRSVISTSLYSMVGIVLVDWLTSFLGRALSGLLYG